MAKEKNRRRKFKNSKQYSPEEKYRYHSSRESSCGRYGLKFGGAGHCYSSGFVDAFHFRDNTRATTAEFGKKSGNSYALGYKRGSAEAMKYFKTTGKQPGDLTRG